MPFRAPDYEMRSEQGAIRLWLGEFMVFTTATGRWDQSLVEPYLARLDRWALSGIRRASMFYDLAELEDYDISARLRVSGWILSHRRELEAVHVFTNSLAVRMGARLAKLVLGGLLHVHETREGFEAAFRSFHP